MIEWEADDVISVLIALMVWSLIMTGHNSVLEGLMALIVGAYFGHKHIKRKIKE